MIVLEPCVTRKHALAMVGTAKRAVEIAIEEGEAALTAYIRF